MNTSKNIKITDAAYRGLKELKTLYSSSKTYSLLILKIHEFLIKNHINIEEEFKGDMITFFSTLAKKLHTRMGGIYERIGAIERGYLSDISYKQNEMLQVLSSLDKLNKDESSSISNVKDPSEELQNLKKLNTLNQKIIEDYKKKNTDLHQKLNTIKREAKLTKPTFGDEFYKIDKKIIDEI